MRGSLKLRRVEIEECDQTCGDEKIEEKKKEKKRKEKGVNQLVRKKARF